MAISAPTLDKTSLSSLLRGEAEYFRTWIENSHATDVSRCVIIIVAGSGLYGAAIGYWRAPLQALFVAAKLPLIILLTTLGNALLNAMLAPLLGLNIGFKQSLKAMLMSFTIASAILGALSPVAAFMIWNMPPLMPDSQTSGVTYNLIQLSLVAIIAFAGIAANLRLVQLLKHLSGKAAVARRVLFAWLAGNLFLGSQLAWILRPFIGSPDLPVVFLRPTAFQGNFYETVFRAAMHLLQVQ
ncbi:MAG TPA: hypothetical protein VL361_21010 [Candidatus Limnocylindrales bacterium]|jgi:hypothetical protein|nr:hypothetical protein [Candidatus Limnocylindrales bacterium]